MLELYKTLNGLTNAADHVEDGVEGEDLTGIFENLNAKPLREYAFSQMARCPAKNTLGPNSACNSVERKHIEYMGFTVRDDRWRYTAWLKFDGVKNAAIWSTIDNDDDHNLVVHGEELYDHLNDTGVDFDKYENVNVNKQYPNICKRLFQELKDEFDTSSKSNSNVDIANSNIRSDTISNSKVDRRTQHVNQEISTSSSPPPPPPPIFPNSVPVFYPGLNGSKCFRIPTMIKTSSGIILAFSENREVSCHDTRPPHQIVLRRSFDPWALGTQCGCNS